MATLAEIATRIPQATAEVTGKKLGSVIDTVKDTLNPAKKLAGFRHCKRHTKSS